MFWLRRNFWNAGVPDDVRFVHFVGTYRYHGGVYDQATAAALAFLNRRD